MIEKQDIQSKGIKYSFKDENGTEIAHAFLYLMKNELHDKPFGLLEDLYVHEDHRGKGLSKQIMQDLLNDAEKLCYKLLCTSRFEKESIHEMYEKKYNFKKWGYSFRIDYGE